MMLYRIRCRIIIFDVNSMNSMILYQIRWHAYHACWYNFPPRPTPIVSNSMCIHPNR
jgi:hypothetical protein